MINKARILLGFIFFLAFVVRIWNLSNNPPGFFCDEASIGYNAYSILTTGKDEYGKSFPVFFKAFGEYKSPLQIYSTAPFTALFGLNELSTRLPSAIYGTLSVLLLYLVCTKLFYKSKHTIEISLLSAFFLSISPWHTHLSRIAFESAVFIFYFLLAMYLFLVSLKNKTLLPVASGIFAITLYTYFPARIFIPIFLLIILLLFYKYFLSQIRFTIISVVIFAVFSLPLLFHSLSPEGKSRWQQVSIFTHPPQDTSIPKHIFNNYLSHFSYDYLFKKGDIGMPGQFITRHSVKEIGELYLFQLPLILIGVYYLFKTNKKMFLLLLFLLLLYPLGSAFTIDKNAQATRSVLGVLPFQILSAVGLVSVFNIFPKEKFTKLILLIIFFTTVSLSAYNFSKLYFVSYPMYSADFWGWQYGPRDIVSYFENHKDKYDQMYMEGMFNEPAIFFKFYAPNGCEKCYIGTPHETYNSSYKQLFATTPDYLNRYNNLAYSTKKIIYYPNGLIAFKIIEIVK